jgi:hypothetical protein
MFQPREVQAAPANGDMRPRKWAVFAYAFSSVVVIASLLYVWIASSAPDSVRAEFAGAAPPNLLWSRIFDNERRTTIVVNRGQYQPDHISRQGRDQSDCHQRHSGRPSNQSPGRGDHTELSDETKTLRRGGRNLEVFLAVASAMH